MKDSEKEKFYNTISTSRSSTIKPKKTISKLPRHIGIDKLHIHIPLYPDNTDGSSGIWKKKRYANTPNGQEIQKFEGFLEVSPRTVIHISIFNYGSIAEVQFNPSRVLDKEGSSLCPLKFLEGTVLWVLKQLEGTITPDWCIDRQTGEILEVWPSDWYSRIKVTRIDLAVDITTSEAFSISTVRQSVSNQHKITTTYENKGVCNSLEWGKKPWLREIFYSKGNHPNHKDSKDVQRFEVQIHREFIRQKGWQNLEKITVPHILRLIEERWAKSGLSEAFSFDEDFASIYNQLLTYVTPSKAMNFLGSALVANNGLVLGINPKTVKEYQKLSQILGFSFGSDITKVGKKLYYLDLKKGKMLQHQLLEI